MKNAVRRALIYVSRFLRDVATAVVVTVEPGKIAAGHFQPDTMPRQKLLYEEREISTGDGSESFIR